MNFSQLTRQYLRRNPAIASCLTEGLVNLRALARRIASDNGCEGEEIAIAAALRRIAKERMLRKHSTKQIERLLHASTLRVRTNLIVATLSRTNSTKLFQNFLAEVQQFQGKERRRHEISIVQGEDATTLMCAENEEPFIRKHFGRSLLRVRDNASQVLMIFPPEIEYIPGVVVAVYQALYNAGLNILEEMSCWTELMMIVDSQDLPRVLEELQKLVGQKSS